LLGIEHAGAAWLWCTGSWPNCRRSRLPATAIARGRAELFKPAISWSTVRRGLTDNISAAVPATIGVAKLVPKLRA
jgi:hypothetical protein